MTKEVPRTSVLRDAELNKTLIARLRGWARDIQTGSTATWAMDQDLKEAAERIEQFVATNEALSISNATLIAERDEAVNQLDSARHSVDVLEKRCRTLIAERATCEKYRDAYAEMGRIGTQAVRDLEAKLAENEVRLGKAVEALEFIDIDKYADIEGVTRLARKALAEIKSHSDEFATQKGESHE